MEAKTPPIPKTANDGNTMLAAALPSVDGHSVDGSDMSWKVACPACDTEIEYGGYFDSGDKNVCTRCKCNFTTRRLWLNDKEYVE